jgi:hypothetical protein
MKIHQVRHCQACWIFRAVGTLGSEDAAGLAIAASPAVPAQVQKTQVRVVRCRLAGARLP